MRRQPAQARSRERVNRILDAAEALFASQGYAGTTTNAIAARAAVPIGSLYQFFPDKAAILLALALRYTETLRQKLTAVGESAAALSLADYANQLIDNTDRFFSDHPSYRAVFMEAQGTVRELEAIEETVDAHLIRDLAASLPRQLPGLAPEDYDTIAFVLVKTIGTLLWLSLGQPQSFRQRLTAETKRLTLHYLNSYVSPENTGAG
jgi:AcrR family transcriptional regulator